MLLPGSSSARAGLACLALGAVLVPTALALRLRGPAHPVASVVKIAQRIEGKGGGSPVAARYEIVNRGRTDLVLGAISTSCGCSVASVEPRVIRPGQRGRVEVRATPPGAGEREVTIAVATNDPERPELALRLTLVGVASVPYVSKYSGPVRFGDLSAAANLESFFVETRELQSDPPWIAVARSSSAALATEGGMESEHNMDDSIVLRRYRWSAKFAELPPPGDWSGEIQLLGRGENPAPIHRFPVFATLNPPVFSTPAALYIVRGSDGNLRPATLTLRADDDGPTLEVEPIDVPPSIRLSTTWNKAQRIVYRVEYRPDQADRSKKALVFRTNSADCPTVRVPVVVQGDRS